MEYVEDYKYCAEYKNVRGGLFKRYHNNYRLRHAWVVATSQEDYHALLSMAHRFDLPIRLKIHKDKTYFAIKFLIPDPNLARVT